MNVTIDPDAGFCFGVDNAITIAEAELAKGTGLYCLDEMVHNTMELERLKESGLKIVSKEELAGLADHTVLIRAHGEPPSTYEAAREAGVQLIDATCPIVLKLQERIHKCFIEEAGKQIQIVIFGKKDHPEVIGLSGYAGDVVVVSSAADLSGIDFSRPVRLYSQTTMDIDAYEAISREIEVRMKEALNDDLIVNNSYCRQVSRRSHSIREFADEHDTIIFVSDRKSSNGAFLFNICKAQNKRSHFVITLDDINPEWFVDAWSVGVTGATSTPAWLMTQVAEYIGGL